MRSLSAMTAALAAVLGFSMTAAGEVPVLVLPFADGSGGDGAKWVESAIQQSLVGDVGRGGTFKPLSGPAGRTASDDLGVAISAARQMGAPYVVFGSYQVKSGQLQVTAQAVDVQRMQFVGGVNVSRHTRELFSATDALGSHVVGHLRGAHTGGNAIQAAPNAIGASPVSRLQMPLTSLPLSYVDWAAAAQRRSVHDRPSQFAQIMPSQVVLDHPLEQIPNRLVGSGRGPGGPFSNQMQGSDGNQISRSDGNSITGVTHKMEGLEPNTLQRGDGNTMSFNRGERIPTNRLFGNTMGLNRGPRRSGDVRTPGNTGSSITRPAAGAVRPGAGRAVQPGSGNAITPPPPR